MKPWSDGFHTYTWDSEGRPHTIDTVGLTYDALGRMVEQARGSSFKEIVYGLNGGKLALMTGQTLQKAFVALPSGDSAVYTASGLAYYRHADWLGSSRFASTPARAKYYDVAYAPYGENYANSGTTDLNFTGQNQDTAAGLYDFPVREYHPVQGRWVTPDPAGAGAVDPSNPQSWNRYAYVTNSPLNAIDPSGMKECRDGRPGGCFAQTGVADGIIACLGSEACATGGSLELQILSLALTPTSYVSVFNGSYVLEALTDEGNIVYGKAASNAYFADDIVGITEVKSYSQRPVYGNIGLLTLLSITPSQQPGGGAAANHVGSPKNLIEHANKVFVQCVKENGMAGVGKGVAETVFDAFKNKEAPSTRGVIVNVMSAALDVQKDCLGEHPLADLSPNYQGFFNYGDPGVDPIVGGLFPF